MGLACWLALSVASARVSHHAPFPLPATSNRTCGFAASGSPTGFSSRPTARPYGLTFTGVNSSFRDLRTVGGVARPCGQSPGSWSLPQRTRSEAPSLPRHYPSSTVLWASPTPPTARPVPHGRPVGLYPPQEVSRVASFSLYRHALATTPVGPSSGIALLPLSAMAAAFPKCPLGRLPHQSFRGLLSVHAC